MRESFADHVWLFIPALDIYLSNKDTISLIHSHFPLSLWKDDNIIISLNEERKASLLPRIVLLGIISTNLAWFLREGDCYR